MRATLRADLHFEADGAITNRTRQLPEFRGFYLLSGLAVSCPGCGRLIRKADARPICPGATSK